MNESSLYRKIMEEQVDSNSECLLCAQYVTDTILST